jgi:hypothetical protein
MMTTGSRRLGRFRISDTALCVAGDLGGGFCRSMMGLMGQMIIIRATDNPFRASIDYWAISPLFDELEEGAAVPWYEIEYQTIDHGEDYEEQGFAHQFESVAKAVKWKPPGDLW